REQGPRDQFMEIETRLALRAVRILGVEPSTAQVDAIVADRGSDTLRAYQLFNDTLGEAAPARGEPPAPQPKAPATSWPGFPGSAWAAEARPEGAANPRLLPALGGAAAGQGRGQLPPLPGGIGGKARPLLAGLFRHGGGPEGALPNIDVLVEGNDA